MPEPGGNFLAAVPYFLFPGAAASNNNNNSNNKQRNIRKQGEREGARGGSARVEHLIRFLKCPIKIADTFRPYFFGIPYKSRAVIPHAIAASSWAAAAAVDFATQRRDLAPEVAEWALAGEEEDSGFGFWFWL